MKQKNIEAIEAISYIIKKFKIKNKPSFDKHRTVINRYSSLQRIETYIKTDPFVSKYKNTDAKILDCEKHYFLDFWVHSELITFVVYK